MTPLFKIIYDEDEKDEEDDEDYVEDDEDEEGDDDNEEDDESVDKFPSAYVKHSPFPIFPIIDFMEQADGCK